MKISIINGPNLNLLGTREPDIYGNINFEDYLETLKKKYPLITFDYFQSNIEGEIINKLHENGFLYDGIIINPAGYTHTSVSIADAIKSIKTPVVEVHISNVYSREDYRKTLITTGSCIGIVAGMGLKSYEIALNYFTLV